MGLYMTSFRIISEKRRVLLLVVGDKKIKNINNFDAEINIFGVFLLDIKIYAMVGLFSFLIDPGLRYFANPRLVYHAPSELQMDYY